MDAQPSNSLPDPDQDAFSLGVPSMLAAWKHHCTLLNHELDEACRELENSFPLLRVLRQHGRRLSQHKWSI